MAIDPKGEFSDDFILRILRQVFIGKITTRKLPEELYRIIAKVLFSGVSDAGVNDDNRLFRPLRENVYKFSAAKTFQQVKDMNSVLFKEDGTRVTFSEFKEAAGTIFNEYNSTWLETEYTTAVRQTQMAVQWQQFVANSHVMPNLKYETAGDSRVRHEHALLDGIVKPIDSPFWDLYMPQNDWHCRCTVKQTDEPVTGEDMEDLPEIPVEFAYNPGKDKVIFSPEHPYFIVHRDDQGFADKNFDLPLP